MQHQPNKYIKPFVFQYPIKLYRVLLLQKIRSHSYFFLFASAVALSQNDSVNKQMIP
jgi:hypothetical protein